MDIKYQVFVSSTYIDLIEERQEVMQALLELDCIPVGMELFPAADDDQWTLIKGLIKDCDYYILIVGGRYGSIGPSGKSYTQMEYEFAISEGIPVISFINGEPGKIAADKTEVSDAGKEKLKEFIELAKTKMCRLWTSPSDLGSQVSRSLVKLIKAKPRIGWIKANIATSDEANREIGVLRKENEELKGRLEKARVFAPVGSETLQQGDDKFNFNYRWYYAGDHNDKIELSWNEIFFILAPVMVDEATEDNLHDELRDYLRDKIDEKYHKRPSSIDVANVDFQTIKIQLIALGLIFKSDKKRSIKDAGVYWSLTPYGETVMMQLRALKK
ncbi:DUF4062 domain-containing protein [Ferruginibacter paludis]|uniref:DUF4062 domain-containing protein n=1 Tax=Ferruginibacter paludis TaxID=1310417 RepID=UPI0025B2EFD8|nr:DUF4062 domain-containing protein [Ferruginibacter paludis]MDN3657477.1 DUF4062 domain-containing protein [Ferruginibacter paludis]